MAIEEGEWLSYAEAGARFGISADAARQLAKRRGWQRRIPNETGALATVLVPADAGIRTRGSGGGRSGGRRPLTGGAPGIDRETNPGQPGFGDESPRAIAVLVGQLAQERELSIRAEQHAVDLQARLTTAQIALADASAAERSAAGEAAVLRATLDDLRRRLDDSEAERRQLSERLTGLLSHRQAGSVPSVTPHQPWWKRWFRG